MALLLINWYYVQYNSHLNPGSPRSLSGAEAMNISHGVRYYMAENFEEKRDFKSGVNLGELFKNEVNNLIYYFKIYAHSKIL